MAVFHSRLVIMISHNIFAFSYSSLRIGSCLACVYRVMDARGKFGGHERSVRAARVTSYSKGLLNIIPPSLKILRQKNTTLPLKSRHIERKTKVHMGYHMFQLRYQFTSVTIVNNYVVTCLC